MKTMHQTSREEKCVLDWQLPHSHGKNYVQFRTYIFRRGTGIFLCNTLLSLWCIFHHCVCDERCVLQGLLYSLGTIVKWFNR